MEWHGALYSSPVYPLQWRCSLKVELWLLVSSLKEGTWENSHYATLVPLYLFCCYAPTAVTRKLTCGSDSIALHRWSNFSSTVMFAYIAQHLFPIIRECVQERCWGQGEHYVSFPFMFRLFRRQTYIRCLLELTPNLAHYVTVYPAPCLTLNLDKYLKLTTFIPNPKTC